MAPTTTTESCDRRVKRIEQMESPLITQLAAAITHLRTAGERPGLERSLPYYPHQGAQFVAAWIRDNISTATGLLSSLAAPHARVEITSYGVLHQDPPTGDALTLDLTTALRNPPEDPAVREVMIASTGLDQVVLDYVMATPGALEIAEQTVLRVLAQAAAVPDERVVLYVYCRGGRHRSVALARTVGQLLQAQGADVTVTHRHVHLPVVENAR
ncbi:RapZ C-terminal domain-containing protein [Kitasatospora sp. NPDC004289]